MSEPIYHFKRGEGWVLGPEYEVRELVDRCGIRYRMEARPPEAGEYFGAAWGSVWMKGPGVLDLDKFEANYLDHKDVANDGTVEYYNEVGRKAGGVTGWVTYVILENE